MSVKNKLAAFNWEILTHPPYSPDLAPSDYYLFLSLKNSLHGKKFTSKEGIEIHLAEYLASKSKNFWATGILKLPDRWAKVVEQHGTYIVE